MSHNYYAEINLHVVWHTKQSAPILVPEVEAIVWGSVRVRALALPGVYFHEVGGTETHIHLAVSIPPTLRISEFIGQLKGGSSHEVNHTPGRGGFEWQHGYGVVSFGTRDLEWVTAYIRNQKQHHAAGQTFDRLERISESETPDQ